MGKINITQVRSRIGSTKLQKKNLDALGLRKMNRTVQHEDSPTIMGMVEKVRHLVVIETAVEEKAPKAAKPAPKAAPAEKAAQPAKTAAPAEKVEKAAKAEKAEKPAAEKPAAEKSAKPAAKKPAAPKAAPTPDAEKKSDNE